MKNFSITVFKIIYGIFSLICTLFIVSNVFVVLAHSLFTDNGFDFQIILYAILSFLFVIGLWSLFIVKTKFLLKILFFLILLVIQFNYLKISELIPSVRKIFDMELCVDMDICPEGIKMKNDQGELFVINKENCIKYGYTWNDKRKDCNLRN